MRQRSAARWQRRGYAWHVGGYWIGDDQANPRADRYAVKQLHVHDPGDAVGEAVEAAGDDGDECTARIGEVCETGDVRTDGTVCSKSDGDDCGTVAGIQHRLGHMHRRRVGHR